MLLNAVLFQIGWGDCFAGCFGQHFWRVEVTPTGATLTGQWGDPIPPAELERAIGENPEDGNLLELFARAGASCATASAEQRQRALDRAQAIYDAQPAAEHCEALAMAMAAHGRFEEAIEYQAQALFEAARRGGLEGLGPMQAMMKTLEAKQRPRLPWDATHPLINPPRIGTDG